MQEFVMRKNLSGKKLSKFKKTIYSFAALSTFLMSSAGFAQLPPTAFKNFSRHYKKKSYDVVIGAAGYESGFIYDLRFLGNFKPAYDANKNRVYSDDSSDDPLWILIKYLFPSPSGQLTTERALETNFGKNATPQSVALLQNFANDLREGKAVDETKLMKDIVDSFGKDFKVEEDPKLALVRQRIESLREPKAGKQLNLNDVKKEYKPLWDKNNKEITDIANAKNKDLAQKKKEMTSIVEAFFKEKENNAIAKKREPFEDEVKPIVENIKEAISKEKDSLYMAHTTEQVISSFFCAKFNTQADIREYMENLNDTIVDKTNLLKIDDYLKSVDLEAIASKPSSSPFYLDEFYDLAEASVFTSLTPYKEGSPLLSNGNTYRYDRKLNLLQRTGSTFADCAEMGARHIMNLLLYDNINRVFDLSHLKQGIKSDNQYFKNFEDFYLEHSPTFANAGDIETRSKWNRVVGDLNAFDSSIPIKYMKGSNELNAGLINFVQTFQKIFNLDLEALPTTGLQAQKEWLKKSLTTLFSTVNPTKTYKFDLAAVKEEHNDLSGAIGILVSSKEEKEALFSFNFRSFTNVHSDVQDLKMHRYAGKDFNEDLQTHVGSLQSNTIEEMLWMLTPPQLKDSQLNHPLYKLFNTSLADNDSRIAFLEKINEEYDGWKSTFLHTPTRLQAFKNILGNVLNEISWDDLDVVKRVSPLVLRLEYNQDLQDLIYEKVRGLYLPKLTDSSPLDKYKKSYNNLETLSLEGSKITKIDVTGLNKLSTLSLYGTDIRQIDGLNTLERLRKLDVSRTDHLAGLNVTNLIQLAELNINNSGIRQINGLSTLKNLETLMANSTKLKIIDVENLTKLKTFDARESAFRQVKGINTLESLETLYVCTEEEEINVENLKNLKTLGLVGAGIRDIKGLHNLKELEVLNLNDTRKLKDLDVHDLNQLNTLELKFAGITTLKSIETLKNLKRLDLFHSYKIDTLKFTEDKKDLTLNLQNSSIKNRSQIQGIEFLNEDKIYW